MKKLAIGLISVIAILVIGYQLAEHFIMGGDSYYVQITTDGEQIDVKSDNGDHFTDYQYELKSYDENGKEKEVTFNGNKERPLRKEAYLKLTWNAEKGVTGYEEVQKSEIPQKAQEKLDAAAKTGGL